jgi:16S rRNA G966 N2-methylase RsmD
VGANRREGTCYEVKPLPEGLVAGKNTYVYDAHTYHTKVPPQAIAYLIEHYAEPGELVLDPFCGSGMTGVAALRTGRIPILIDLSPAATFIAYNFLMIFNEQNVFQVFERKAQTIQQYLATWAIASATPFCISTQSATDLGAIPDDSIDYISTAPPSAEISTILR